MWQPDGWGRTRIGVLTPHADVVPETEFNALAPDGISIHAARVCSNSFYRSSSKDHAVRSEGVCGSGRYWGKVDAAGDGPARECHGSGSC
jgi:hypothetical protein